MKNKSIIEKRSVDSGESESIKSVKIDTQIWAMENLKVSKFRNGDPIPEIQSVEEWVKAGEEGKPAWCCFDNYEDIEERYGKLYNWYAINDARGLAPRDWHIPSDEEWRILTDNLGGSNIAGISLKFIYGWEVLEEIIEEYEKDGIIVDVSCTNESGFSALPGGRWTQTWGYDGFGRIGGWWSSTEINESEACNRILSSYNSNIINFEGDKNAGYSVRCLRN